MLFSRLADYLEQLERTPARLEITRILAKAFKESTVAEVDKICYLSLGELAPKYMGLELNLAEKMMIRSIAQATGQSIESITKDYKKTGDLGEVILKIKDQRSKIKAEVDKQNTRLQVSAVYDKLVLIAKESGTGSQERKLRGMAELLGQLDGLSAKFVARIPVKKLRLGFSDMTVLDALSWMEKGDKSLRASLEKAFNVSADIGRIAQIFKTKGLKGIEKIGPEVGVPIRAAKAIALNNPKEILEKMSGKTALEPKYDGFRTQIHIDKDKDPAFAKAAVVRRQRLCRRHAGKQNLSLFEGFENKPKFFVRIFSRNLDNTTYMFPEVVAAAEKLKVKSAILDGEAIAINLKTGKFLPFQETVQRKRKHNVAQKAKEIPLKVFVFDLLYLNGESLLAKPFKERRVVLEKVLGKNKADSLILTEEQIVAETNAFGDFFKQMVKRGLEGLMAKKLDAAYQAGNRNFVWIKYKTGMQSDLADTIDCIVMGYYRGKGKRNKFGIGAFLVGIPDGKGKILSVSKIGTGLTDKQWREMKRRCQVASVKPASPKLQRGELQEEPKEYDINKNLFPDVWCRPKIVVEIEADTITKSPIHTAGLALRFPRLKRFRDDKEVEQATSLKELKNLAGKF
ncbi:hypothetical protein A2160_04370 [Candidatus Beckwithbacteria bacterium RBG_13_42_9]|uniref:DNA ligase (ATP) n=1 Tax=Candidatus Beckwithbacteria bacterium RBG_13_42_9 TaxID=1797457 RepID=A0A1F5E6N8_9BACT|nr:MAG: hypothetical protein A2160_04370 [Candidatus Beckwithbacteria bacterium RBG_13_42_9]